MRAVFEDSALHFKSIVEVSELIRTRRLRSLDVTKTILSRIEQIDDTWKSYVHVCADRALGQAQRADQDLDNGVWRGLLHGVPIAVKDLCYTNFAPTAAGTRIRAGLVPSYNATVVDRLETAGCIMLGKLSMTEGAYTSHHPEIPYPPNPWNKEHWVGSSSTGSGVGTAVGLCYGSLGSDTGGSIRFPSATCGLTGIKPTWGRVSRYGVFALADTLDHIGPMARSAADCAAILQAIAGWDRNDPTSIDAPVPEYSAEIGKSIRDMRIGVDWSYALDGVDAEVGAALREAAETFERLGARIVNVDFPAYKELVASWIMMCSIETAIAHEETYPARAAEYGPELRQLIEQGQATTGLEVGKGIHLRAKFTEALATMFRTIDLLLIPTMPVPIPTLSKMSEYGEDPSVLNGILRFTAPFDFSGNPTITVPNGFDSEGMPLSMQLVAPRLGEAALVRAGHAYQTVTDWHRHHPRI